MRIPSGSTDRYIYFVAVDATDLKSRETGLTTFTVYFSRDGGDPTSWATPNIAEVSSANLPGVYKLPFNGNDGAGITIDADHDTEEIVVHITSSGGDAGKMAAVTRVFELYRPETTEGLTLSLATGGKLGSAVIDAGSIANDAQYELDRSLLNRTTIASLTGDSQTLVVLTAGSTDLNAYKGCLAVITDVSTSTQRAFARITQSTVGRQITLDRTPSFTIAADDKIDILLCGATPDEADAALADIHLDHLLAVNYDPASKPGVATALLNELVQNSTGGDAGISQFTANSLELAPTGGSAPTVGAIATEIWDTKQEDFVVAGSMGAAAQGGVRRGTGIHSIVRSDSAQVQASPDDTHIKLDSGASSTDDHYNGMSISLTGGTGSGKKSVITGYVGSTRLCTVSPSWSSDTPDASTKFTIWETTARHLGGDGTAFALKDIHLDHLLAVAYADEGHTESLLRDLTESDGGTFRFTSDALGQAPSGTGASASTIADAVWNEAMGDHHTPTTFGGGLQRGALLWSGAIETVTDETHYIIEDGTHSTGADSYVDCIAVFTDQSDRDIVDVRRIVQYNPVNQTITVDSAPDNDILAGDYLTIVPALPLSKIGNAVITGNALDTTAVDKIVDGFIAHRGTATAGGDTAITLQGTASGTANTYKGAIITLVGGTGIGQSRRITSHTGAGRVATIEPPWTTNPTSSSEYVITGDGRPVLRSTDQLTLDGIQTDLSNETDGLGALKALIDAVDDYVDSEVGDIKTAVDLIKAQTVDAFAELAQGIPTATPTMEQAVMYLYMALRNKLTVTASEKAVYNNAGTKITKKVLSDDGTTYTEAEAISGA